MNIERCVEEVQLALDELTEINMSVSIIVEGVKDRPGVAASIFKPLSQNLINVDMVVQNISLNGKETDLTFTIKYGHHCFLFALHG